MARKRTPKPEVIARETEVVKLRRGGLTWDMIAERVGYRSPSAAHFAYQRASMRVVQEDIEAIRKIETERLDMAQSAIWGKVLTGDNPSIANLLRIMDRRAKLLGLDQPAKQQIEVTTYDGNTIDREVSRLVELLNSSPQSALDTPTGETEPATAGN
jgi:hypothetical protein